MAPWMSIAYSAAQFAEERRLEAGGTD